VTKREREISISNIQYPITNSGMMERWNDGMMISVIMAIPISNFYVPIILPMCLCVE
jgi:hypothetical protein